MHQYMKNIVEIIIMIEKYHKLADLVMSLEPFVTQPFWSIAFIQLIFVQATLARI